MHAHQYITSQVGDEDGIRSTSSYQKVSRGLDMWSMLYFFIVAGDISNDNVVAMLLSAMETTTYRLLKNLEQPATSKEKTFKEIVDILKKSLQAEVIG